MSKAKEIILRAAEGQSLAPEGAGEVVLLEVYCDSVVQRAITYARVEGEEDLVSTVYHHRSEWPRWVLWLQGAIERELDA